MRYQSTMNAPNSSNDLLGLNKKTTVSGVKRTSPYVGANSFNDSAGLYNTSTTEEKTASTNIFDTSAYKDMYNSSLNDINGEIDKFVEELTAQAQGNMDFAAKWLEANFKLALGSDDTERANFFKKVASALETKVGRVVFDYETGSYRNEQDRGIALERLKLDETEMTKQYTQDAKVARVKENATLNQRGMLSGTREGASGYAGEQIRDTENAITDAFASMRRKYSEGNADVNLAANRNAENLTTTARRAGIDETATRDYGMESAKRQLEADKLKIEQDAAAQRRQAPSVASMEAMRRLRIA